MSDIAAVRPPAANVGYVCWVSNPIYLACVQRLYRSKDNLNSLHRPYAHTVLCLSLILQIVHSNYIRKLRPHVIR